MVRLSFFDETEVEAIHQATLRILSETGLINEPKSRELLTGSRSKGAGEPIFLLPPELVEKCIALAGKKTTIRGRAGTVKTLGDGNLYFHNLGRAPRLSS